MTSDAREPLFTPAFLRLWAFGFITFFSAFQLFPVIPLHIIDLGGSKADAGMFLSIYTISCAFAAPLTGAIADRFGRKRLLILASALFVIFSILYGLVEHWNFLLAIGCIHGVCWSAILSSSGAINSEIIPASRRTEGLAYFGMASTAAVSVAPLVGLLVYRFGWRALCAEMAGLSIVMIIVALWVREPNTSREPHPLELRSLIDWRVVVTALALFVISFSYGGITSYVAILTAERGMEPRSLFFTVFALTIVAARIVTSSAGDKRGPLSLLYPSLAIIPFALLVLAFADNVWLLSTAAVLYGVGFGGGYPAFMTYVLGHTNPARRAATFGSVLWAFDTGIGTGSFVVGRLVERLGFQKAFIIAGVLSTLSIPIFRWTSRLLKTD